MKKTIILLLLIVSQQNLFAQINTKQILETKIVQQSFVAIDSTIVIIGKPKNDSYTLIDFYFTTCKPCNKNLKKVEALKQKFGCKLNVINVNPTYSDLKEAVLKHRDKFKITNPIVYGYEARKISAAFKLPAISMAFPFYILINKENKVVLAAYNNIGIFSKIKKYLE